MMGLKTLSRGLAVGAFLALGACSGDLLTGGPLVRPGEPTGTIVVHNQTGISVPAVAISACDVGSYGLNRLPDGMWLDPGESYAFTVSSGCWDVLVGNGYREVRQRMQVRAGGGVNFYVTEDA
ncbi:hypothetical protein [Salibaculum halophilum]|uniref:hypothetical protein n=1 Tax=Salibaculum halophilum TaxID=1914408 RepID=UPI000A10D856|nr:hypothetical protein [Salibaculum halophilum]